MSRGKHRRAKTALPVAVRATLAAAAGIGAATAAFASAGSIEQTRAQAPAVAPAPARTFSYASPLPAAAPATVDDPSVVRTSTRPPEPARNWIAIPRIGISAQVVPETINARELSIPAAREVGWWTGGAGLDAAATAGTTLLAAHVNLDGVEGAFSQLYRAAYGERIYLRGPTGRRTIWAVVAVQTATKSALPQSIFTRHGPRRLVLVTCTGHLVTRSDGSRSYDSNLVVTATPVAA